MDAVALMLFDWAVMTARPFATPVTTPVAETCAMDVFEEVHFGTTPDKTRPEASSGVATSWTLPPGMIEAFCGARVIDATLERETLTDADAVTPLIRALIVTDPSASVFMTPVGSTVAIVESEVTHSTLPTPPAVLLAASWSESPRMTRAAPGEIESVVVDCTTTVAVSVALPARAIT